MCIVFCTSINRGPGPTPRSWARLRLLRARPSNALRDCQVDGLLPAEQAARLAIEAADTLRQVVYDHVHCMIGSTNQVRRLVTQQRPASAAQVRVAVVHQTGAQTSPAQKR